MSVFDDRKAAAEARFALDGELEFKAKARRNKMLGLWAAELMGLKDGAAEAYAKQVIVSDFDEPGEEDVYRKIMDDLREKNVDISEHRVRRRMNELLVRARTQIINE